jgi:acyl CoA:acetate/3-ketoacid CoA transferase beta subunit
MEDIKARIAARAARELKDGDVVNLGIGLPTMVADYLPEGVSIIVSGMGGAMDPVVGARKVIIAMTRTRKGKPKILKECTLPYTAVGVVDMIITEMGVMEVTPQGIVLTEVAPGFTPERIQAATWATLILRDGLGDGRA